MYGYIDVWTKQANKAPCSNEPGSQVAPMCIYTPLSPGLFPTNPDRILLHINKAKRAAQTPCPSPKRNVYIFNRKRQTHAPLPMLCCLPRRRLFQVRADVRSENKM